MTVSVFARGNQFLRQGKLEEAIASYEKAIELNPQFAWSYQNLGDALEQVGRRDEAIAVFRRAVANCPESPWPFYKLGIILGQQGQFQEGVYYLRRAIDLKKDVPQFYLGLGSGLVKLGQWSQAVDCINQAVGMWDGKVGMLPRMSLQAEADFYLAEAKSGQEQWSEAVEFYGRSWKVNPDRVDCCLGWAGALGKLARWEEALELYRQGTVLFEESSEVWLGLGQALGELGRWEEAIVEYERAVSLGFAGPEVRHYLGSALMQLDKWGEAEIELRKATELYPRSAMVWQQLGNVLRELGHRGEAEAAYRRAVELKSRKNGYVSDFSSSRPQIRGVTSTSLTRGNTGKIDQKFDRNNQGQTDGILKSQNQRSTCLNVLFVLYESIDSNGGYHAQLHGSRLLDQGVDCLFAVPESSDNGDVLGQSRHNLLSPVRILPYSALSIPGYRLPFADGRGPDVIHAWTPREVVRKCVERLLEKYRCPLVIHLEDNEEYLSAAQVGRPFAELVKLPEVELDKLIPGHCYHPIKGKAFLKRAQGLTMIIETLKGFNFGNVPELVLGPPVDESLFYPRPINQDLRGSLGISEGHVVLAYTGNVHGGNRDEVEQLYQAVEILNLRGCPTTLLRTGLNYEEIGVEGRGRSYEKYLGWVERGQVPEILAAADVLVQPGIPGGFNDQRVPSKLLEYFAMGRPVVLPKTNLGLRVNHGREGYVLLRCDAEGIAAAVQEIKADGELARRLSDGAVDFYLSQVEQGSMGVGLNDFYGRLTGNVWSPGDGKEVGRTFFVVTPCLNAGETIDETIKSVIGQSGDFWVRYHVQDGGSTDLTVERLRYWEGVLLQGSSDVQCRGVEFSWVSEPDQGMYDGVMRGFKSLDIGPEELMTWINADDVLMPGALSAICRIVGEHPEVEWMGGPQYVFETDVQREVLQRSTPTPTAVIREGLCDGKHWEMLQQEGTFFSRALWFRAKHGLKGFELAGDWNFWREMAHHGVYYQYESPLGAFRRRVGQLSVERIGDYRAEIDRVVPLEVRRGRFEELYREQEWDAKVIRCDDGSGRMVVGVESVREVYQKVGERLSVESPSSVKTELDQATISAMLQRSQEKIRQFHNKHLGQRCVIIGNGPSLNEMDLSFLRHEICFGMNKIYLGFERWNFSPTYYVAVNEFVIEQSVDGIRKMSCPKFIGNRGISSFNPTDDIIFMKTFPPPGEAFSKRPDMGLEEGATVTYVAMQLAYYMGFSEVVLIGVDHHFVTQGTPHKTVVSDGDDPNHFDSSYFGKGLKWQLPDLEGSEKSYRVAKQVFEESGRRIIDATVNGRCQVFPKENYRLVFSEVSNQSVKERQSEKLARIKLYQAALNAYKQALKSSSFPDVLDEYCQNQISLIGKVLEQGKSTIREKNIVLTACNSKYFNSLLLFIDSLLETNAHIVDYILVFDFGLESWEAEIISKIKNVHVFRETEESLISYPPYKRFKLDDPSTYFFKVYGFHEGINYCRKFLDYESFNLLWCDSGIKIQYSLSKVFSIIGNESCFFVDHSDVNIYYKGSLNNLASILSPKLFEGSLQLPIPTKQQLLIPYIKANFFGFKIGSKYDILINLHRDLCCLTDILFDLREITEKSACDHWKALYGNNPDLTYKLGRHEQAVWSYLVALSNIKIRRSSPFNFTVAAGSGAIGANVYKSRLRRILEQNFTQFRDSIKEFVVEHESDGVDNSVLDNDSALMDKYLELSKSVYLDKKLYGGIGFPHLKEAKSSTVLLHRGALARSDQNKYVGRLLNYNTNLKDDIFVLLGNGPSLADVDLDSLSNFDTFGMNAAYRAYDRINFWPKYLGCFDPLVCGHHSENFKKLIRDSPIEGFFFINFNDERNEIFTEQDILSSPKFQRIRFQYRTPEEKKRTDILSVSFERFIDMRTSGPNVIQVGLLLGYRKFIMLGVDQNYTEVVDGAKKDKQFSKLVMEKTPDSNPNYWFADYQQKGDRFNRPNLTKSQIPSWNNLSQTLECLGIKAEIYNCSPITKLECFKKASLSFAIKKLSSLKTEELSPYRSQLGILKT